MNFGRARRIVRAVSGITLAKRIVLEAVSIPAITSAAYDNPNQIDLVECVEAMDEEVESDDSAIADVPLYSRLLSLKLFAFMQTAAAPGAIRVRWLLYKKPDGETLAGSLIDGVWHTSEDTPTQRELRKYTVAKGILPLSNDNLNTPLRIFVKKQAWARVSPMRENDKLCLILAQNSNATITLSGFGTIYAKANA